MAKKEVTAQELCSKTRYRKEVMAFIGVKHYKTLRAYLEEAGIENKSNKRLFPIQIYDLLVFMGLLKVDKAD